MRDHYRLRLPDGRTRTTTVDVQAWIPDPRVLDEVPAEQRLDLAIDYAEAADALQSAAHSSDEDVSDCCQSDCWVTHLDQAMLGHPAQVAASKGTPTAPNMTVVR